MDFIVIWRTNGAQSLWHKYLGPFMSSLCHLCKLSSIILSNNSINQTLPLHNISRCNNLKHLDPSEKLLTGPLPNTLPLLPNFRYLNVTGSNFSAPFSSPMEPCRSSPLSITFLKALYLPLWATSPPWKCSTSPTTCFPWVRSLQSWGTSPTSRYSANATLSVWFLTPSEDSRSSGTWTLRWTASTTVLSRKTRCPASCLGEPVLHARMWLFGTILIVSVLVVFSLVWFYFKQLNFFIRTPQ